MPARSPFDTDERRKARGQRIRWAREVLEPNRLDFARKLGIDVTTIRDIEMGKTNPGIQVLHALCHSLRISLDYIVEGRLSGVDQELAVALCADHPELLANRRPTAGSDIQNTERQTSTFPMRAAAYTYR